jgi:CheY-like chemotaxis protein
MNKNNFANTVLIIEDDLILQKALSEKFVSENFSVLTAVNGEEGIKIALLKHPDVITLDLLMPIKDGINFMDEIRQDEWGKNVPIIILTNYDANDQMISKVIQDLPSYYFIKSNTSLDLIITKAIELLNGSTSSQ